MVTKQTRGWHASPQLGCYAAVVDPGISSEGGNLMTFFSILLKIYPARMVIRYIPREKIPREKKCCPPGVGGNRPLDPPLLS